MTDEEKKAELLQEMMSVPGNAEYLEKELRDAAKGVRLVRDVIQPLIHILKATPAGEMLPGSLDNQLSTWKSWNSGAQQFSQFLNSVPMSAMNYGSVNSAMHTASSYITVTKQIDGPAVKRAMEQLTGAVSKQELADKAMGLLNKLDLDHHAADRRSPVDLLNEARGAMEGPVTDDSVTSILIPLRESIEAALAELIRRRPQQEKTKGAKAKIVSVGAHCGKTGLSAAYFEQKGEEAEVLLGKLSGGKQAAYDRLQLTSLYQRGLLLLVALLESVDGGKLRRTAGE
jgi:hypothetical protein